MISDLEQIAEEMERFDEVAAGHLEPGAVGRLAARIRAWIAANKESEASLRMILWLEHGHQGLYGDDGEMQCNVCTVDYKRQPMARLIDAWNASRRERQVSEAKAARPQRKAFVEAAMDYFAQLQDGGSHTAAMHLVAEKLRAEAAYRAMIEAEKVEAERWEGTK